MGAGLGVLSLASTANLRLKWAEVREGGEFPGILWGWFVVVAF